MSDSLHVTVHIGSQDNNLGGNAEVQFASREFDRNNSLEISDFVSSEVQASSGFMLMYATLHSSLEFALMKYFN